MQGSCVAFELFAAYSLHRRRRDAHELPVGQFKEPSPSRGAKRCRASRPDAGRGRSSMTDAVSIRVRVGDRDHAVLCSSGCWWTSSACAGQRLRGRRGAHRGPRERRGRLQPAVAGRRAPQAFASSDVHAPSRQARGLTEQQPSEQPQQPTPLATIAGAANLNAVDVDDAMAILREQSDARAASTRRPSSWASRRRWATTRRRGAARRSRRFYRPLAHGDPRRDARAAIRVRARARKADRPRGA